MNPTDCFFLFACVGLAGAFIAVHGLRVNSIGPAALVLAAGLWYFWMQWLRYRNWVRHRDSGFVPGTQHLSCLPTLGLLVGLLGSLIWVLVTHRNR